MRGRIYFFYSVYFAYVLLNLLNTPFIMFFIIFSYPLLFAVFKIINRLIKLSRSIKKRLITLFCV